MLAILALTIAMVSCGGRSKNRKLVQAQEIHKEMMTKYDSIYKAVQVQENRVAMKLEKISANNPDRAAYASMQRSIKRSYDLLEKWKQNVTSVPGFEPDNDGVEKQDKDPSNKVNTTGMNDQEILDLQNAYSEKLDQIGQKIGELVTTMDMYTKQ